MLSEGKGVAAVCKWNESQFGKDNESSKDIEYQWFVLDLLDKNIQSEDIAGLLKFYQENCHSPVSLEIVDYFCLPGQEMVAICKTFWLKIIQRKWKKVYAERQRILKRRKAVKEIQYRQRFGHWSNEASYMPTLEGMMAL